jgi:hypothetical protein
MLRRRDGKWETAPLDRPYGRGAMLQVNVDSIEPIQESLEAAGWPLYAGTREVWREVGGRQVGQRESSCWTRTVIWSWSRIISVSGRC